MVINDNEHLIRDFSDVNSEATLCLAYSPLSIERGKE